MYSPNPLRLLVLTLPVSECFFFLLTTEQSSPDQLSESLQHMDK